MERAAGPEIRAAHPGLPTPAGRRRGPPPTAEQRRQCSTDAHVAGPARWAAPQSPGRTGRRRRAPNVSREGFPLNEAPSAASSVAAAANTGNTGQYQHPAADTASASPSDPTHARRIAGLSDTSIMQRQTRHALNI